jgi:hypothetical protein
MPIFLSNQFLLANYLIKKQVDEVAEWLRRLPAKQMGFAREGSNPFLVDLFFEFEIKAGNN